MKLTVIGTGYVGLVTGACFAEMGNTVTCMDVNKSKIEGLRNGVIPIHEPGIDTMVSSNCKQGRLFFASSLDDPHAESSVYFIAVGTPPGEDGSADLSHVLEVAKQIGQRMNSYTTVVDKSTVPVGTADKVRKVISTALDKKNKTVEFDVVSNPEFLKEGAAIEDFMKPDRIIVGTDSDRAKEVMHELYLPFMRNHNRIITMGVKEAEMTKYAANSMLATKISFMNEISNICASLDVDVESVRQGIGSDSRIGYAFIYPGAGYGGSCFPKDVRALIHTADENNIDPVLLNAVVKRNDAQKHYLYALIKKKFKQNISNYQFGLWGLAFKSGTDDMREAPSITLLQDLINAGANVRAYDPEAMVTAKSVLPASWFAEQRIILCDNQYDVLEGIDALILITEWKPFRHPDFALMKTMMKSPVIFDGRNLYDKQHLLDEGFQYYGIGR